MNKIEKSETIFHNKRFSVKCEEVIVNGHQNSYTFIDKSDAVGIIALVNDEIWLVEQYRHSINERIIEIPGGKIEKNETPINAAIRELKEETGLVALNMKLLTSFYIHPSLCNELVYIYFATQFEQQENELENSEIDLKMIKVKYSNLLNLIENNKIKSSADGYALLYFLNINNNNNNK